MKFIKTTIVAVIILFSAEAVHACDICGCGVGSYYLGILPEFNKRFGGLRYQHKTLRTHLGINGETSYLTTDETYQTAEIWGGWNFGKRFRVLAFVPYNFNERQSVEQSGSKNGLGDVAVMGYYNVFSKRSTVGEKLLVQSLYVGAGVKLPTGKYEPAERLASQQSPNNFQLGTASVDYTVNLAYDIRLMDFGVNANLNYKINTENKYNYLYGNKFTSNVLAYYKFRVAKVLTIAPNAGLLFEQSQKDNEDGNFSVDESGGHVTSVVTGVEASVKRFSFGANYQTVASQHLAGGTVDAGNRFMAHVSIAF